MIRNLRLCRWLAVLGLWGALALGAGSTAQNRDGQRREVPSDGVPPSTPGVIIEPTWAVKAKSVTLPEGDGDFAIYTFEIKGDPTLHIEITGANKTGFSLLNASSTALHFPDEGPETFAPGTTFQTVYARDAGAVGKWSGKQLIPAQQGGFPFINNFPFINIWYTPRPPALPADGQTVLMPIKAMPPGREAVWLHCRGKDQSRGFLITTPSTK